jgi:hypothetical protein
VILGDSCWYQSVFTNEDTSDIPTPDGKPYSSMPEITVSIERVQKLLQKLNPQKACFTTASCSKSVLAISQNLVSI